MIRKFLPKVNWDQLDIKNRSAAECEARWMSSEDPLINNSPWTKAEDNHIRLITQNNNFADWLEIASKLGTKRTPFQCLVRYQRSLNPNILKKEWTKEEDKQLRAAVNAFGEKNWQDVAHVLQGRTGTQCSTRWKTSRERKGSSEEIEHMKVAMLFFGTEKWHKIAQFVPGRTASQCREKWKGSLNPKVKRGKWAKDEDAELMKATEELGIGNWSKVVSHLPSRTRSQCQKRWERLSSQKMPLIKEARRLLREATVGNFVDLVTCDVFGSGTSQVISEQEQPRIRAPKKKRKARQKKLDAET